MAITFDEQLKCKGQSHTERWLRKQVIASLLKENENSMSNKYINMIVRDKTHKTRIKLAEKFSQLAREKRGQDIYLPLLKFWTLLQ